LVAVVPRIVKRRGATSLRALVTCYNTGNCHSNIVETRSADTWRIPLGPPFLPTSRPVVLIGLRKRQDRRAVLRRAAGKGRAIDSGRRRP
jgi:hypothetical protein